MSMPRSFLVSLAAGFVIASCGTCGRAPESPRGWLIRPGAASDDQVRGIAVDGSGNIHIVGEVFGTLTEEYAAGDYDIFVIKYDALGNRLWDRQFGTKRRDLARGIAVDSGGNVYIAGYTSGALDGNSNAGGDDLFVAKLDPRGATLWVRQIGTALHDSAWDIVVDANGTAYAVGTTQGGLGGVTKNDSDADIIVVTYDASGNLQWIRQFGSARDDAGRGIAIDGSGNLYVVGETYGGMDGNVNAQSDPAQTPTADGFIVKLGPAGERIWTGQFGTRENDHAYHVAVDGSDAAGSRVVATGSTEGSMGANRNWGETDMFVAAYDAQGNRQWVRHAGTPANDYAYAVAADGRDGIYVAGTTYGTMDGEPRAAGADAVVIKYRATDGAPQWVRQYGTPADDFARGVAAGRQGYVYLAGTTYAGPDGGTRAGTADLFVIRYDPAGLRQ